MDRRGQSRESRHCKGSPFERQKQNSETGVMEACHRAIEKLGADFEKYGGRFFFSRSKLGVGTGKWTMVQCIPFK